MGNEIHSDTDPFVEPAEIVNENQFHRFQYQDAAQSRFAGISR
jgi:hypothetical protein